MAKVKTKPKEAPKAPPPTPFEVPVAYGNVSVGDKTASIRLSVSRGNLTVGTADRVLCGKRLSVTILARRADAQADQDSIPGMEDDYTIEGVFDVKSYSVTPKHVSFGLSFMLEGLNVAQLAHFAKREGVLTVEGVEDLPDEGADDGEASEA